MLRPKILVLITILAALATGIALWKTSPSIHTDRNGSTADIGGPFTLIDQTGKQVTDKTYHGEWSLVFFGFTNCPDICPTGVLSMTEALKKLGKDADNIRPIFITLDPARDTSQVLGDYLKNFSPRWVGLTGTNLQINAAASEYRVYHSKQSLPESEAGYTINHSGFIYLMNPDGEYRAHFRHSDTPDEIAAGIKKALADE